MSLAVLSAIRKHSDKMWLFLALKQILDTQPKTLSIQLPVKHTQKKPNQLSCLGRYHKLIDQPWLYCGGYFIDFIIYINLKFNIINFSVFSYRAHTIERNDKQTMIWENKNLTWLLQSKSKLNNEGSVYVDIWPVQNIYHILEGTQKNTFSSDCF